MYRPKSTRSNRSMGTTRSKADSNSVTKERLETFAKAASSSRLDTFASGKSGSNNELRLTSNFATVAMPILLKDELSSIKDEEDKEEIE